MPVAEWFYQRLVALVICGAVGQYVSAGKAEAGSAGEQPAEE